MIIALFPNTSKAKAKSTAIEIREFLKSRKVKVVVEDSEAKSIGADPLSSVSPNDIDFMIALGGDGTILRLIHRHPNINAPLLGINLGSFGFMADTPVKDIIPSLEDLLKGDYRVDERIMMQGSYGVDGKCQAVNEIVVHRAQNPSLIDLVVHVDGKYLNTFAADGLILATPCGSTAYSMAAGGPILSPDLKAFVLTPICPHTISNRPVVLLPKKEVQIQYVSRKEPVEVSSDGLASFKMNTGESIRIGVANRKFRLVGLKSHDYFSTLRTKLGWTGKLRNVGGQ